jgi:two-component system NtrC family sensor kinase
MIRFRHKVRVRHRLLTRLLISHVLLVSVPLLAAGLLLIQTAQQSIRETILQRNLEFVRRTSREIQEQLKTARQVLRFNARSPFLTKGNDVVRDYVLTRSVDEFSIFKSLAILDRNGQPVVSTNAASDEAADPFRAQGVKAALAGRIFASEVYVSDEQLPLMNMYQPIWHLNEVEEILFAVLDLKTMWDLVASNAIGEQGEAFIFDATGHFIAHSDVRRVYRKERFEEQDIVQQVAQGESLHKIYRNVRGRDMVAAYAPLADLGWGVVIQQPVSEAFAPARKMRLQIILLMIGSIVLASSIAYFYTRWIVKPVNVLVSGLEKFSTGDLHHRIPTVSRDEVGMLAERFNEMADRLVEIQSRLKRTERFEILGKMSSVLSHEIRNPLNSMVINMQIMKREFSKKHVDTGKLAKYHDIVASEIKRVDRLVSDFLLIARPPKLNRQRVELRKIVDEIVAMQQASAAQQGVSVERLYAESAVHAYADEGKLKQVLLNIFINAVQAMPEGGRLRIGVNREKGRDLPGMAGSSRRSWAVVWFEDTGHGIPPDQLEHIFDFYYSTKEHGTGLGLSVAQQIVEEHGGRILVESEVGTGTKFTIVLPVSQRSDEIIEKKEA